MSKACLILAATLVAAAGSGSVLAAAIVPMTVAMGDTVHIRMPTSADLAGVDPRVAKGGGWVHLGCQVGRGGVLKDCAVIDEHPAKSGFGQAALRLSPTFHAGRDRKPSNGVLVVPVLFDAAK